VDASLESALERFVAHEKILIALDFDGTLAPLVDDPADSRMLPASRVALDSATDLPGIVVALVTGRAIESAVAVSDPDSRWWLVGSHGSEVVEPGGWENYHPVSELSDDLLEAFADVAKRHPGTKIEIKPRGIAFHTRGLSDTAAVAAAGDARVLCENWPEPLTIRTGHGLIECSVRSATKGDGVRALVAALEPGATLFIGDDKTDEDGFAVLGGDDLAIRCGPGDTIAPHRLPDSHAVAEFLARLVTLRAQ
jgi:trehalose 6-phosphate phosphatase